MNCCFRFALAAGFLALPLSLFAEEKGSPPGGDHRRPHANEQHKRQQMEAKLKELKQQHPQLTPEQKEKIKAAMQQREQKRKEHHQEMQAKMEEHKQEMQAKIANWKENHPNDKPPMAQNGPPGNRQLPAWEGKFRGGQFRGAEFAGGGAKGPSERLQGGGHPGGGAGHAGRR